MTWVFRNDWREILHHTNCTIFAVWNFEIERDRIANVLQIEFMLLGLGIGLCFAMGPVPPAFLEALHSVANRPAQSGSEGGE